MPGTINLNCIRIASMERIAGWLKALHKNCVDCRPIPEFNCNPQPFRRMFCRYCGLYHFFAILTQCSWILSQFPNLTQSFTILRIAKGLRDSWAFPWILGQSSNLCVIHSGSQVPSAIDQFWESQPRLHVINCTIQNRGMPILATIDTININFIMIAILDRIASWLEALHKNCVDCRTIASPAPFELIPELNCNPCPSRKFQGQSRVILYFFAIRFNCKGIVK